MQHLALMIFGWFSAAVFVVGLMAGPKDAAGFAVDGAQHIGTTVGSIIFGMDDGIDAFMDVKRYNDRQERRGRQGG